MSQFLFQKKILAVLRFPSLTETSENTPKTVSTNNSQTLTNASEDPIAEGTIRLHFQELPSPDKSSLGLWTWDDVETPSSQKGAWPTGATSFAEAKQDDYGVYLDVKLSSAPKKLSFLINNAAGTNLSGDKAVEILSPQMNEAGLTKISKFTAINLSLKTTFVSIISVRMATIAISLSGIGVMLRTLQAIGLMVSISNRMVSMVPT